MIIFVSDKCANSVKISCHNGGYQDPLDCSKCRCPDGLGGRYCHTVGTSTKRGETSNN